MKLGSPYPKLVSALLVYYHLISTFLPTHRSLVIEAIIL